jgi:hypothetical protein
MRAATFPEILRKILIVILIQGRLVHEGCSLPRNFEKKLNYYLNKSFR